jgi:hypothetical protein
MSRKVEMINSLLESGHEKELYELLTAVSTFNRKKQPERGSGLPPIELTKLVGMVREHLLFISRHGVGKSHVIEDGRHSFAYPDKFSEWLNLDAPGIYDDDLELLYKNCSK